MDVWYKRYFDNGFSDWNVLCGYDVYLAYFSIVLKQNSLLLINNF